jgi:hypothetical protein
VLSQEHPSIVEFQVSSFESRLEGGSEGSRTPLLGVHSAACEPLHHTPHNTPGRGSDPGWTRTTALLRVREASSPLDHGIVWEG